MDTDHVIDVGGGVGHLSRYLAHRYSLNLTCIDCVPKLSSSAA